VREKPGHEWEFSPAVKKGDLGDCSLTRGTVEVSVPRGDGRILPEKKFCGEPTCLTTKKGTQESIVGGRGKKNIQKGGE